jgi:protein-S-isoprenylcysteine O-methyltransferase Ste14
MVAALALSLALVTQFSFLWAIRRFFRTEGRPRAGMRAIAVLGGVSALAQIGLLAWRCIEPMAFTGAQGAGLALFVVALVLFWSAVRANRERPLTLAFTDDAPEHLVVAGPYRYIRHPFYAAYLTAWLAGAFAAHEPALLLSVLVMGTLYAQAASVEERKFARSPLAAAYAAYRRHTGVFCPPLTALLRRPIEGVTCTSTRDPAKA